MPLLGQPFKDYVREQVDVRQSSLGKYSNISTSDLKYYTTKTPWIRLASSVNISETETSNDSVLNKLLSSNNNISKNQIIGDNLAKNLILQGGVTSNEKLNSGLSKNGLFNGAYGWGGIEERGYVPMPGITNADIQYLNNGALTKTTINIRCFSKQQFQLIDILYLRPGYTLLLEFGHSVYLDNDGKLQKFDNFSTTPLRTLLNPGSKNQFDIYKEIEQERIDRSGNYDAVYGKISNFNWQFNPDGSYDCQVILTGMGDVIESLKVNVNIDVLTPTTNTNESANNVDAPSETILPPIIANKDKTLLNQIIYDIFQDSINEKGEKEFQSYTRVMKNFPLFSTKSKTIDSDQEFLRSTLKIKNAVLTVPKTTSDSDVHQSKQIYITFGTLMAYIQSYFLLYNNVGDKSIPLSTIDMDFNDLSKDENYILTFPGSFSSDPMVCLIPYTNTNSPSPDLKIPNTKLNQALTLVSKWKVEESLYLGRLAGIFININYIDRVISDLPLDDNNQISILSFLKEIIKGITQSLGGFNEITVRTTIDGKIQFVEDIPANYGISPKPKHALFKTFGVESGKGSFIKNINLTAEISSDFSTMISIGAQSNGNQFSANATAFSNYNLGLEDRLIEEKSSYTPPLPSSGSIKNDKNIESNWTKMSRIRFIESGEGIQEGIKESLFDLVYKDRNFLSENITSLKTLNTTHADLVLGKLAQPSENQQIESPFFLPFNFSLEMEGLSGMVLYQKFEISEEILPPSYEKGGVEIQIKGINHSINNTEWTTKLDTLSTPSAKVYKNKQIQPYKFGGEGEKFTPTNSKESCEIDFGNELYSTAYNNWFSNSFFSETFVDTIDGSVKSIIEYGPKYNLTFRGESLMESKFNKLMTDGFGNELPKEGWKVARVLYEAMEVIGKEMDKPFSGFGAVSPTTINSGYRSPVYNCTIPNSATNSVHKTGGAVDIGIRQDKVETLYNLILRLMNENKIPKGGLGKYNSFVHYDIRGTFDTWNKRTI